MAMMGGLAKPARAGTRMPKPRSGATGTRATMTTANQMRTTKPMPKRVGGPKVGGAVIPKGPRGARTAMY